MKSYNQNLLQIQQQNTYLQKQNKIGNQQSEYQNKNKQKMFNPDDSYDEDKIYKNEYGRQYKNYKGNEILNNGFYDQFSFKLNQSRQSDTKQFKEFKQYGNQYQYKEYQSIDNDFQTVNNTLSLRQNLVHLDKNQIIELLLQQIKSTNQGKSNRQTKNKQKFKCINLSSDQPVSQQTFGNNKNLKSINKYKTQYQQLVKDFEQYISNTRQAQQHYVKNIQDLKKQNKLLNNQIKKVKSNNQTYSPTLNHSQSVNFQKNTIVNKLQQTVQKYVQINNQLLNKNNQLSNKLQKLQKQKRQQNQQKIRLNKKVKKLQFQCDLLQKQNQKLINQNQTLRIQTQKLLNENQNFRTIIQELKQFIKGRRQIDESKVQSCISSFRQVSERSPKMQQKFINDSIMDSSQIKKRETSSHINQSQDQLYQIQNKKNTSFQQTPHNNHFSFNSIQKEQQPNAHTYQIMQIQNKQLKLTNMKLQELIQRKSQKIRKLLQQIEIMGEQRIKLKEQIITLKCLYKKDQQNRKINIQDSHHKNNQNQIYQIGGAKMVNSSLYSLKTSEITSDRDFNNKDKKTQLNNIKSVLAQKKALILQGYANCFKKSQSKIKLSQQSKPIQAIQKGNKEQKVNYQNAYIPNVLCQSNKKSSGSQKERSGINKNGEIRNESYGVIKKRNNPYKGPDINIQDLSKSGYSTSKNSKYLEEQGEKENI